MSSFFIRSIASIARWDFAACSASLSSHKHRLILWRVLTAFLSALYEPEVRYLWRGDGPYELEPVQIVADAVEKSLAAAE